MSGIGGYYFGATETEPMVGPGGVHKDALRRDKFRGFLAKKPAEGGLIERLTAWFNGQETIMKVAIVAGGIGVLATAGYLAMGRGSYKPNPGRRRKRRRAKACAALKSVGTCRCGPPKKYRRLGATRRSQYALPECFMYPIMDARHVRTAASRFGKYRRRYPKHVQQTIARRIDTAKRRFGIGQYR